MLQRYSIGRESISPRTPGKLDSGETIERNHADVLSAQPRFDASAEILRGEKFVQIHRDVRKGERVVFARRRNGEDTAAVCRGPAGNHDRQ